MQRSRKTVRRLKGAEDAASRNSLPVVDLVEATKHEVFASLIQWMPSAEKRECINLAVFVMDRRTGFVGLRSTTDDRRLRAFDPRIDLEYIHATLEQLQHDITDNASLARVCDKLPDITSNCLQMLPLTGVISSNPAADLDVMEQRYLVAPHPERTIPRVSTTATIRRTMSSTFQHYGVWSSMLKKIPVKDYVRTSRIKIDCAYMTVPSSAEESRQFKMFHALDVETERDRVTELVQTYPEFGKRLREDRDARPVLNVICGDSTSTANQIYTQPYDELHEAGINTYRIRDLAMLAATARQDLHMRPL